MKKEFIMRRVYLFLGIAASTAFASYGQIVTMIKGTIVDRPQTTTLYIAPEGTDFRADTFAIVNVTDGRFEYTLSGPEVKMYMIVCKDEYDNGTWKRIPIFTEGDTVKVTIYPKERNPGYEVSGGRENTEYKRIPEMLVDDEARSKIGVLDYKWDSLMNLGLAYSPEAQALLDKKLYSDFQKLPDSLRYTPEVYALKKMKNAIYDSLIIELFRYIARNPSVAASAYLADYAGDYVGKEKFRSEVEKAYEACEKAHPDSYLINKMHFILYSKKPEVGKPFFDFTLPDLKENEHTLSKEIKGKVALLDLWASWCGPCRKNSMSMIPVYEEFREKGFTVIGVARERTAKDMEKAAKQDRYPWLNLLELNDGHDIWRTYGLSNSGGMSFLIDDKGIIIAINPTADEVRKKLNKIYNK